MYITELKTHINDDNKTVWIQIDFELIGVSKSDAQRFFSWGWTIYGFDDLDRLNYCSWWSLSDNGDGVNRYHQFPEYLNYFVSIKALDDTGTAKDIGTKNAKLI